MSHHQVSLSPDRPLDSADVRAAEAAKKLHSMVQRLSGMCLNAEAENHVHGLLILAQAANGLLHLLARISMPTDESNQPVSSTAVLFAALMAYHTAPCEVTLGTIQGEFSPLVIFDAIKDVERLIGQSPDSRLHKGMCKVARECAADPSMLDQINKARSHLHRQGATLN